MTGRSPMRSVRAPHGTSVSMPPPVTAAKARPTSPRLSPNSPRTARAERGQAHAQRRERAGADRAGGEDDPAVARASRGGAPRALAMPARLGLVAAQRHRAPAPAAGRRAIVEARRARLRGADADARGLVRRAEHARRIERDRAQRARAPGRRARARRGRACRRRRQRELRPRGSACASQPSMVATAAAGAGSPRERRLQAERRSPRAASRASRRRGARHARRLRASSSRARATGRDRRA